MGAQKHVHFLLILICLCACNAGEQEQKLNSPASSSQPPDTTHVMATILKLRDFELETLSQGQILAKEKVDVSLPANDLITQIHIRRGQRVTKGQILAALDTSTWQQDYELLQAEMEEKLLQQEAKLISLGYDKTNTPSQSLLEKVSIELGIPLLQKRLAHQKAALARKNIIAPINGIVADLEGQAGNSTNNFKKLCTLINDRNLEVKFPILESEIAWIQPGMSVVVTPFYGDAPSEARVTSFDPMVDEHGLIWVYADIHKIQGQLLDGMKVRISARNTVPHQRVLPKAAVLDRQDRYVIFVYKNGAAHWVYGHIDQENSTHYTLKDEGPQPGDTVIISNNFNLAHLEPVLIDSIVGNEN